MITLSSKWLETGKEFSRAYRKNIQFQRDIEFLHNLLSLNAPVSLEGKLLDNKAISCLSKREARKTCKDFRARLANEGFMLMLKKE